MIIKQAGSTLLADFTTKDQTGSAFVPEIVQVSIVKSNGREDLVTYLGNEPGDSRLVAGATPGIYSMHYPIAQTDPEGVWFFNARWRTTYLGEQITCTLDEPIPFRVNVPISGWGDT